MIRPLLALVVLWLMAGAAFAQGLTALARVDQTRSALTETSDGLALRLGLSQPVPYRVFTLDAPRRLVLDFSVVAWDGFNAGAFVAQAPSVTEARVGTFRPEWSRMVLALNAPMAVASVELRTGPTPEVVAQLRPVSAEAFAETAGVPESLAFEMPRAADLIPARTRPGGERPVTVVLDPGHGGIDPGAERGGVAEAHLMLQFALELREVLLRSGGFDVVLTRETDVFVPLEMRQSIAREAGADVFLSLHADALPEGFATGAAIYTLAEEATDVASEKLAERHNRVDLLAGVDLSAQDDVVAKLLMDLARADTEPRTDRLADALVVGLRDNIGPLYKRPRMEAAFSVLKSADIPSVLIELGFMSSKKDLANLVSPEWRARAAVGILSALRVWAAEDASEGALLRQ